jgi:hypothetical protein
LELLHPTNNAGANVDSVTSLLAGNDKDAFRTGVTHGLTARLPLDGGGAAPLAAQLTLRMLAFDDLSAIGDREDVLGLTLLRRSNAKRTNDLLDEVEKARKSSDAKREFEALIAKHRTEGMMWVQLGPLFEKGPEFLDHAISMYRDTRDLLVQQSEVKRQDSPGEK